MRRRTFLQAGAAGVAAGLAGCGGLLEERSVGTPTVYRDRPDAVYYPTHIEGMRMIGSKTAGDRRVGLFYSYPHRFWNLTGTSASKVEIQSDHSVHLMASTWDPDSGTVLPTLGSLTFTITQDGSEVDTRDPWPMLSQNMGFHFGENMALSGDGTYTVTVDVGAVSGERVGSFEGKFSESITADFEFEYTESEKQEIEYTTFSENVGSRAAVEPMEMDMLPLSVAPEKSALPGSPVTVGSVGDATLVATVDGSDLIVSPRTPYNRFSLPGFSLSATLGAFDGTLASAIGPDLGAHYRAELPETAESGAELTVSVDGPNSLSRHEGYETAFLERGSVSTTL